MGICMTCGKPANGELMNARNGIIGPFCTKHGQQETRSALDALKATP
jgi:hypothetical protein